MENKKRKRNKNTIRTRKYRAISKAKNYRRSDSNSSSDNDNFANNESSSDGEILRSIGNNEIPVNDCRKNFPRRSEEEINIDDSNSNFSSNSDDDDDDDDSDDDGDDDDSDVNQDQLDILRLRTWAIEEKIDQNKLDKLLHILRRRLLTDLPKSSKTFLKTTEAKYEIEKMNDAEGNPGEFAYFGLKKGLEDTINPELHPSKEIELKLSVDGIPLSDSGDTSFWPLLCHVYSDSDIYAPFPVSIFSGKSKPESTQIYFKQFVSEANDVLENGINVSGHHFLVKIKCFICDTPARAFCKNTVGHHGKFACERCIVKGTKKDVGSTVFPSRDCKERSDESFRQQEQPQHHNGLSKLLKVKPKIDMVFQFVLDFMHLCCLGMMKKLIEIWMSGNLNTRLDVKMKDILSDRILILEPQIPCEFQRKLGLLRKYSKWKATQFYFFLIYCGPIILKNVLRPRLYKHFLLLHAGCRILCSDRLCLIYNRFAKEYLRAFFEGLKHFYGKYTLTINSHNLIHLADDVWYMKCSLNRISAFVFENFLGTLKRKIRTPNRPLAQVCRRMFEEKSVNDKKANRPPEIQILKKKKSNILKIKYKEYTFTTKEPDNVVMLKNKKFLQIRKIRETRYGIQIDGFVFKKKSPLFDYPFDSSILDMWEIERERGKRLRSYFLQAIEVKAMKISMALKLDGIKRYFVVPLLHH
ncbi:uncharacterized protein LOC122502137 [Leptopilina heterotoma]|uniref:uncharacterized protein LOC122502137 n=1 Tax=Leptopilina heterotoma TaxID=63436 RepID=UPI001CA8A58D|nr:uncharacterized protein LOC122502137 [Leptopilina heterotoma]